MENTLPDQISLLRTNLFVKIQRGGTLLTLNLQIQTVTTIKIVPDQLLLTGILQIVDLSIHTKKNQSPAIFPIADNLGEVLQAAFLVKTMTVEQSFHYGNFFDLEFIERINTLDGTTKPVSSWYLHLNVLLKRSTHKSEPNFLEIEFLLDTGAIISILDPPSGNAIKIHLHQSKNESETDHQTKLRTAINQLILT